MLAIPCHRLIRHSALSGYLPGMERKGAVLEREARSRLRSTLTRTVTVALAVQIGFACTASLAQEGTQSGTAQAQPVRTGKEGLSSKASDEQRVDDCKVPPSLRGSKARPDDCRRDAASVPER
jgi:hypothetical protein